MKEAVGRYWTGDHPGTISAPDMTTYGSPRLFASHELDAGATRMVKSVADKSRDGNPRPDKELPCSKQVSESVRILQTENRYLRDLVVSLSAALMRHMSPDPVSEPRAVSCPDAGQLTRALNVLSKPFPGHELLTSRERVVLAEIVRGASSKEIA
jgi:hypothetical protein